MNGNLFTLLGGLGGEFKEEAVPVATWASAGEPSHYMTSHGHLVKMSAKNLGVTKQVHPLLPLFQCHGLLAGRRQRSTSSLAMAASSPPLLLLLGYLGPNISVFCSKTP